MSSFRRKSKVPSMESYPSTPISPQPSHYTLLMRYPPATLASFLLLTPAKLYPTSGNGTCCSLRVAPPCPFSFSSDGISLEKPFLMILSKVGPLSTSPFLFCDLVHESRGVITAYFCMGYCHFPIPLQHQFCEGLIHCYELSQGLAGRRCAIKTH